MNIPANLQPLVELIGATNNCTIADIMNAGYELYTVKQSLNYLIGLGIVIRYRDVYMLEGQAHGRC